MPISQLKWWGPSLGKMRSGSPSFMAAQQQASRFPIPVWEDTGVVRSSWHFWILRWKWWIDKSSVECFENVFDSKKNGLNNVSTCNSFYFLPISSASMLSPVLRFKQNLATTHYYDYSLLFFCPCTWQIATWESHVLTHFTSKFPNNFESSVKTPPLLSCPPPRRRLCSRNKIIWLLAPFFVAPAPEK